MYIYRQICIRESGLVWEHGKTESDGKGSVVFFFIHEKFLKLVAKHIAWYMPKAIGLCTLPRWVYGMWIIYQ